MMKAPNFILFSFIFSCTSNSTQPSSEVDFELFTKPEPYREGSFGVTGNLGIKQTAVILATFEDMLEPTVEPGIYSKAIFEAENSINSFIKEISFNQTSLSGSVFGWYSLERDSPCDYSTLLSRLIELTDYDIDFSVFSNLIIITPQLIEPTCLYSAGAAAIGPIEIVTDKGNHQIGVSHVIWEGYIGINNKIASFTIAHELLHSFGMWHANSLDCIPKMNNSGYPSGVICLNMAVLLVFSDNQLIYFILQLFQKSG
ncbi:MAG: hypothetical protein RLN90_04110 [Balneolaceae bacterium]